MPTKKILNPDEERARILKSGSLHWFHWFVVIVSLLITLFVWILAKNQAEEKIFNRFELEANRIKDQIIERMRKYEDGLWGGVGALQANQGMLSAEAWSRYAESINLAEKYPGINGIGVIVHIDRSDRDTFLQRQRATRPYFNIHPDHDAPDLWPIVYIEPVDINREALGLDMAHETNRYTAAQEARDSGLAKITGPITLVQDAEKTPGFLFYAPFYEGGQYNTLNGRREHFLGLVYAPFVVHKLMEGTLAKQFRNVGLKIEDEGTIIFSEHTPDAPDFDPKPLFQSTQDIEFYGRTWTFSFRTSKSFKTIQTTVLPHIILICGLLIDSLLLTVFILMARSNRMAVQFADRANQELSRRKLELERSNADLEQFAYAASHDLQEPIRMITSYTELLELHIEKDLDPKGKRYLLHIVNGAKRIKELIDALLTYSRLDFERVDLEPIDLDEVVRSCLKDIEMLIAESNVDIKLQPLPKVMGSRVQLRQVFHNLITNAIKFCDKSRPEISIYAEQQTSDRVIITVEDNGIGIKPEYQQQIFTIFKRLHTHEAYSGQGIGLSIVKKVILQMGGDIWVQSEEGKGAKFQFSLKRA